MSRVDNFAKGRFRKLDISRHIETQKIHMDLLFSGQLDSVYASRARRIGSAHRESAISLGDYLMAYGWFLNEFEQIIVRKIEDRSVVISMMAAMRKLVFLDMSIAASTYYVEFIE
ncbi:protoglobin domain-containing protein [Roseibium sp.]|uniref:protoglobin domain-containing protein n=1 Tax=Roseibium sp. TaxID=1936156 RepID=UPI003A972612